MAYRVTTWSRRLASISRRKGSSGRRQCAERRREPDQQTDGGAAAGGRAIQLGVQPVEGGGRRVDVESALVADVVDEPGEAVDGEKVLAAAPGGAGGTRR